MLLILLSLCHLALITAKTGVGLIPFAETFAALKLAENIKAGEITRLKHFVLFYQNLLRLKLLLYLFKGFEVRHLHGMQVNTAGHNR